MNKKEKEEFRDFVNEGGKTWDDALAKFYPNKDPHYRTQQVKRLQDTFDTLVEKDGKLCFDINENTTFNVREQISMLKGDEENDAPIITGIVDYFYEHDRGHVLVDNPPKKRPFILPNERTMMEDEIRAVEADKFSQIREELAYEIKNKIYWRKCILIANPNDPYGPDVVIRGNHYAEWLEENRYNNYCEKLGETHRISHEYVLSFFEKKKFLIGTPEKRELPRVKLGYQIDCDLCWIEIKQKRGDDVTEEMSEVEKKRVLLSRALGRAPEQNEPTKEDLDEFEKEFEGKIPF